MGETTGEEVSADTKKELRRLRTARTVRRNKARSEIEGIEGLGTDSPVFAGGKRPEDVLEIMTQHIVRARELDALITALLVEGEIDADAVAAEEFALEIEQAVASIKVAISRSATTFPETPIEPRSSSTRSVPTDPHVQPDTQAAAPTTVAAAARLPRELDISPEIFSGDRLRFRAFMTQFTSFVGKRPEAPPVERLMVLRKYVSGEPKEIVSALELTDANYQVALDLLHENFARTDNDKERILSDLRNLPRIPKYGDLTALRKVLTLVQGGIATLASNGIPLTDFALSLKSAMDAAMPARMRQEFKDHRRLEQRFVSLAAAATGSGEGSVSGEMSPSSGNDNNNTSVSEKAAVEVRKFIEFLRSRVRDWEDNKHLDDRESKTTADVPERPARTKDNHRRPKSTIAAVTPAPTSGGAFVQRPCIFCRATEHRSSRCSANISTAKRRQILATQKRCERCFRSKHNSSSECRGPRSPCSQCDSREHYSSMHPDGADAAAAPSSSTQATTAAVVQTVGGISSDTGALLHTACAYVVNGGVRIPIRVFLDSGSTLTVISPSLRAMIREPPVGMSDLTIQTFASTVSRERVPLFNVRITSVTGGPTIEIFAHEYQFGVNPPYSTSKAVLQALANLDRERPLADRTYVGEWPRMPPSLLIGMNQLHKIMHREPPTSVIDNISAQSTTLGWVVGGSVPTALKHVKGAVKAAHIVCCAAQLSSQSSLHLPAAEDLEKLWNLEAIGIVDTQSGSRRSADEEEAVRQFEDGISYTDGRYVVRFPKRPSIDQLPNNLLGATQRLERKLRQLELDPDRYQRYHNELMKFIEEGFASEVANFHLERRSIVDGSYYMPHREVVTTPSGVEKWRIVFDCSARQGKATSLNDHLLKGPNQNPDLVSLLLGFRLNPIAVSADISKAYMTIAVDPSDQPFFRFLWRGPGSDQIKAFQMGRVTWGAASSGFLLAATVRRHLEKSDPDSQALAGCLYADDFLQSFQDVQQATQFTDCIRRTLHTAGMSLAKWKTSSPLVSKHLLSTGVDAKDFDSAPTEFLKVLGISWSPSEDVLRFTTPSLFDGPNPGGTLTKRRVLSIVASIYDPLGWLTPYTLRGKRIIQRLWTGDLDWNQLVPEPIQKDLLAWMAEVRELRELRLTRQYTPHTQAPVSRCLHMFGDASKTAYACVAFIENRYPDGSSAFSLVMSKSRLAPRDSPSLPRLELLASLIAVRLAKFVTEQMSVEFERTFFYTDSSVAFHWATATNPGNWRQFVCNRVQEIQAGSRPEDWFLVSGPKNISDLATRGISASTLVHTRGWWEGPDWLRLPLDRRPVSQPRNSEASLEPVHQEVRRVLSIVVAGEPLLDLQNFSSAGRATRVLANVIKFCYLKCRRVLPGDHVLRCKAENTLLKWCQQKFLRGEIEAIRSGERVLSSSKLAAYKLFICEDGLLRIRTRLRAADALTYDQQNPIVVPGESRLAKLLIVDAHRMNAHFGVNTILNYLRRRLWVIRGRQVVRAILRRCVTCRRRQGAHATQIEAPLPESRVTLREPFAVSGVDFCGHFFTRQRGETFKSYVALFTCTATRAVHLEAVPSLTTPQTHLAIRRFLATYPACRRFISDNGKSFSKAATDLKRLFNAVKDPECLEILNGRSVDWSFNCPRASWHGGVFERLIGVLKSALAKTLGRNLIGYEDFRTILCELAAVINDRPLTHVPAEADAPAALTPAHFVRGGPHIPVAAPFLPIDRLHGDEVVSGDDLRRGHDLKTKYFRDVSVRWFREYLLMLRTAVTTRGEKARPIQIGDVCLLREDNQPRVRWRLVRILDAHKGRDGEVRIYTVKFENRRTSRRAAQLLYPLELNVVDDGNCDRPADVHASGEIPS